jgi:hypothetical protein
MNHSEMEKSFMIYKKFITFTDNVKREANAIPIQFGFVFKAPNYYVPDPKLEKTLERCMRNKEMGGDVDEDFDVDMDFGQ